MMYKITRLYTNGVKAVQKPVIASQIEFGQTIGSDTAIATTKGKYVVPRLIRAMVVDINTFGKEFKISGIEMRSGYEDVYTAQVWKVEEVQ